MPLQVLKAGGNFFTRPCGVVVVVVVVVVVDNMSSFIGSVVVTVKAVANIPVGQCTASPPLTRTQRCPKGPNNYSAVQISTLIFTLMFIQAQCQVRTYVQTQY